MPLASIDGDCTIGDFTTICAGAVETLSVRPGQKVVGNPARELRLLAAARKT